MEINSDFCFPGSWCLKIHILFELKPDALGEVIQFDYGFAR